MKKFYIFFSLFLIGSTSNAQIALVKNCYYYGYLGTVNNKMLFFANNGTDVYDFELWSSDGTEAGTQLVKDINPGPNGSILSQNEWLNSQDQFKPIVYNNKLYFLAFNGSTDIKLWQSDGTEAGTTAVVNSNGGGLYFIPGSSLHPYPYFCELGGILYFGASSTGSIGFELWRTDGTEAGTYLVKDISINSSVPSHLYAWQGALYFTAHDDNDGVELFKSDGTEAGTQVLKDIFPGMAGAFDDGYFGSINAKFTASGSYLYFVANTDLDFFVPGLYRTDGTEAGTILLKSPIYNYGDLTDVNGTLYFDYDTQGVPGNSRLYKSDGTVAGTVNIPMNDGNYATTAFYNFNNTLYFYGDNSTNSNIHGLFKSDGTTAGTSLIFQMDGSASNPLIGGYITDPATNTFFFRAELLVGPSTLSWRMAECNGNSAHLYYGAATYLGNAENNLGMDIYNDKVYFLGADSTFSSGSDGLFELTPTAFTVNIENIAVTKTLRIFPNPTHTDFSIHAQIEPKVNAVETIEIFNTDGQLIYMDQAEATNGTLTKEVHLSNSVPAGIYSILIQGDETQLVTKLVIQK